MANTTKKIALVTALATALCTPLSSQAADMSRGANNFYVSQQLNSKTVHFKNAYGVELTGTLFTLELTI